MSHIQKILERAERDGSIRPSTPVASPMTPEPMRPTPPAAAVAAGEAIFPIVDVTPATAAVTVGAPRRIPSSPISRTVLEALRPGSIAADQYRTLRTRLQQTANGRSIHALIVTSATRGEGRTHTAASLGLSMTREFDRRVIVVDANLRSPQVHEVFGLPHGPGLSDVLTERARLEDALIHIEEHNISVLPGGDVSTQPELLGSIAMRRIMQLLRAQFDRIVIDAPAAVPVADVALLTPLVDGLMLVVRAGVTPKTMIHDAIAGINSDKLLGIVLNDKR